MEMTPAIFAAMNRPPAQREPQQPAAVRAAKAVPDAAPLGAQRTGGAKPRVDADTARLANEDALAAAIAHFEPMARTIVVVLPIPPRQLSPNARSHWMAKAKHVKVYREAAMCSANAAMCDAGMAAPRWKAATIQAHWFSRTAHRIDGDNALASLKAAFDGMTDAGLFDNDRGLTHLPVIASIDKLNPRVELHITPAL